jgi:hypothetical protein
LPISLQREDELELVTVLYTDTRQYNYDSHLHAELGKAIHANHSSVMGVTFPSLVIGPHTRCELESKGYLFAGYTRKLPVAGDGFDYFLGNQTTLRQNERIRRPTLPRYAD